MSTHAQWRSEQQAKVQAVLDLQRELGPEDCDFDYAQRTLDAGTYCRTCRRHHFGV